MNREMFLKKIDRIENLPTLPAIAMEVNKMLQDDNISINMLAERIEKDQAIVARILKLVNSAFFGVRSKISNVSHAITLLGFNTVRNAVVSVSIIDSLTLGEKIPDFDIKDFWKHSVTVAVVSKYLAQQSRLFAPDDCFIGGLLHDIGKIVLMQHFQDIFIKIVQMSRAQDVSFFEIEKNEIPIGHAQIGGHLAKKWQLPLNLVDTIKCHHTISNVSHDLNFVLIVNAADTVMNETNGLESNTDISGIHQEVKKALGEILSDAPVWIPEISEEIDSACSFFLEDL